MLCTLRTSPIIAQVGATGKIPSRCFQEVNTSVCPSLNRLSQTSGGIPENALQCKYYLLEYPNVYSRN